MPKRKRPLELPDATHKNQMAANLIKEATDFPDGVAELCREYVGCMKCHNTDDQESHPCGHAACACVWAHCRHDNPCPVCDAPYTTVLRVSMPTLHKEVIRRLADGTKGDIGTSVVDVAAAMSATCCAEAVHAIVANLANDGYLYSTIDEFHFKPTN
jgi:hypothetical protein